MIDGKRQGILNSNESLVAYVQNSNVQYIFMYNREDMCDKH